MRVSQGYCYMQCSLCGYVTDRPFRRLHTKPLLLYYLSIRSIRRYRLWSKCIFPPISHSLSQSLLEQKLFQVLIFHGMIFWYQWKIKYSIENRMFHLIFHKISKVSLTPDTDITNYIGVLMKILLFWWWCDFLSTFICLEARFAKAHTARSPSVLLSENIF